jgi:hypothetical protein
MNLQTLKDYKTVKNHKGKKFNYNYKTIKIWLDTKKFKVQRRAPIYVIFLHFY